MIYLLLVMVKVAERIVLFQLVGELELEETQFSSRIRRIALATESAPMASVTTAAVLRRASSPKPKNNSAAQDTRMAEASESAGR